ncbi:MAG: alanine racemase [Desulfobacteraceae bacterium]|nr:alanine racemase [Desulfobacteraceae bacterium]
MIQPHTLLPQTRIEIDLEALAHNVRALKSLLPQETKLMAVVKADAYGHGAVQTAKTALDNGADSLAVGRITEVVELQQAGLCAPILLLGDVLAEQIPYLAAHDIRITLTCLETAKTITDIAAKQKNPIKVHIKVDTGMGRLGVLHDQLITPKPHTAWKSLEEIQAIHKLKGLTIEGIYTHLANADADDKAHPQAQLTRFKLLLKKLKEQKLTPAICHAANSAAIIDMPDSHLKMVRPGIAMYGLWPSAKTNRNKISLKPIMSIHSKIIHLKDVPKGFKISYGSTHITQNPTRIATIPIGYADGYSRQLSNQGQMLVRGIKAPIIGRICMDFTMIDVGHIPDCCLGDEVVIMGTQNNEQISANDIARTIGTINYEVTASLTKRMPIRYIHPAKKQGCPLPLLTGNRVKQ